MANCVQQITWHLKREVLESMLAGAGDYSALEFKMCIDISAQTRYFMCPIKVDTTAANVCQGAVTPLVQEQEVCPVPPDCNQDPITFINVLKNYYDNNRISFKINKNTFLEAFK